LLNNSYNCIVYLTEEDVSGILLISAINKASLLLTYLEEFNTGIVLVLDFKNRALFIERLKLPVSPPPVHNSIVFILFLLKIIKNSVQALVTPGPDL
jgi:hypothetical protein